MTRKEQTMANTSQQHRELIANWDNEDCAGGGTAQATAISAVAQRDIPGLTNAELQQLHVRVIALESLVIALLASATEQQLDCAREMAIFISPRPGATAHPLTTHAATEMVSMVERATHFRIKTSP